MTLFVRVVYPYLVYLGISIAVGLLVIWPECAEIVDKSVGMDYNEINELINECIYVNSMKLTAIGCICAVPVLVYFYRRDKVEWPLAEYEKCGRQPVVKYIYVVLFGLIIGLAGNHIVEFVDVTSVSQGYENVEQAIEQSPLIWIALSTLVAAPLAEELVFRGLIFKRLRRHGSYIVCALISSFAFGFTHGNMIQFVYAFLVGLALTFVYEKYKSLWACITLHSCANLAALLMGELSGYIDDSIIRMAITAIEIALIYGVYVLVRTRVEDVPIIQEALDCGEQEERMEEK